MCDGQILALVTPPFLEVMLTALQPFCLHTGLPLWRHISGGRREKGQQRSVLSFPSGWHSIHSVFWSKYRAVRFPNDPVKIPKTLEPFIRNRQLDLQVFEDVSEHRIRNDHCGLLSGFPLLLFSVWQWNYF